jgi:hypothetical protein
MELAIPFIALSGLYIINRQQEKREGLKRKITTENFSNQSLPNVSPIAPNYPKLNTSNSNNPPLENNLNYYDTPNPATDLYLNQSLYEKKENMGINVGMAIKDVYSLTGDYMKSNEFKHNNMVPFYGAKIKGQMYNEATESQLDNMVGAGSQIIRKVEQAPLFEPKSDMQYPYGTPDMTEFFASRQVPSNVNNNVKPFESIHVGPGLNQGFESQGSGGFNSGMEQRDMWIPKTVDELRVDTNPKMTYILDGLGGPAESVVKNVGIEGFVEKYKPDTFYVNSQDRLFTTTGIGHAGQLLPVQAVYQNNRSNPTPYEGIPISNTKSSYHIGEYETARRPELERTGMNIPSLQGMGPLHELDHLNTMKIEHNNRSRCNQPVRVGNSFSSSIRAAIVPFMDVLKPTKKENVSGVTVYGNTNSMTSGTYTINPYDVPKTTNKETVLFSSTGFVGNQRSDAVNSLTEFQIIQNQRDTASQNGGFGPMGGGGTRIGSQVYDSTYNQTNNDKKDYVDNYKSTGNLPLFTGVVNVSQSKDGRSTEYVGVPGSVIPMSASTQTIGNLKPILPHGSSDIEVQRINPDILKAFRENPYTFSLTNSA